MKVDLLDSRFGIVVPFLSMRSFLLECGCATFTPRLSASCSPHVIDSKRWCRPKYWPLAECPGLRWPQCVGGSPTRVSSPVSAFGLSALRIMTVPVFGLSALRIRCTVCVTRPLHHVQSSRLSASGAQCVILPPAFGLSALRIMCTVCDPASGLVMLGPRPACRRPASRLRVRILERGCATVLSACHGLKMLVSASRPLLSFFSSARRTCRPLRDRRRAHRE